MWHAIVVTAYIASLLLLTPRLLAFRDVSTVFVLLAIWSRYLLAGLHEHTYQSFFAGFSFIALHSILAVAVGLLLVPPRLYLRPFLAVFYLLLFLIIFTGVVHSIFMGMVDLLTRWLFFLVVALLLFRAMLKAGVQPVLHSVLVISVTPLALQFIGITLGVGTPGQDGNQAYIAGYFHGGLFSQMLMTCLFTSILIKWRRQWISFLFLSLCSLGVILANYRTSVIASSPAVIVHISAIFAHEKMAQLRPLIAISIVISAFALIVFSSGNVPERFEDVPHVLTNAHTLIKPPHEYTWEERKLFTGRVYVWSLYVDAWIHGDTINHILGFGPEAYKRAGLKDAHNDLVAFLYAFGIVGVVVFFAIFASQALVVLRVKEFMLSMRLLACLVGYFLINMATGGMGGIEALILFAVLSATTWAYAEEMGGEITVASEKMPAKKLLGARWQRSATSAKEGNASSL